MNKHEAKKLIKKFDPIYKTGSINCNDDDDDDDDDDNNNNNENENK